MKAISKTKRQLVQLLIEAGVKQFPEGANWAAQDKRNPHKDDDIGITLYVDKPEKPPKSCDYWGRSTTRTDIVKWVKTETLIPNWHQTVLSRDEFDQIVAESKPDADGWIEWKGGECPVGDKDQVFLKMRCGGMWRFGKPVSAGIMKWGHDGDESDIIAYRLHKPEQPKPQFCESVTRTIPEPIVAPTLDQLLQDYRNAADFAQRKQAEADEAAKMRDERWQAVQGRAGKFGVRISVDAEMRESEPVITDWRDLRVGDVVMVTGCNQNPGWNRLAGVELDVVETGDSPDDLYFKPKGGERWCCSDNTRWCFIRRP